MQNCNLQYNRFNFFSFDAILKFVIVDYALKLKIKIERKMYYIRTKLHAIIGNIWCFLFLLSKILLHAVKKVKNIPNLNDILFYEQENIMCTISGNFSSA